MSDAPDDLARPQPRAELGEGEALRRAQQRATRLEAEIRERDAQVDALRRRLDVLEAEGTRTREAVESSLRQVKEAAQANAGERDRLAEELHGAQARLSQLVAERDDAATRARALADRLQTKLAEAESLAGERATELEQRDGEIAELRSQRENSERFSRVARAEQRARIRELEQTVSSLTGTLDAVGHDIERAESSSSWRIGHRVSRAGNWLRRRQHRTEGALRAALRRIDELALARRRLPTGERRALPPGPEAEAEAEAEAKAEEPRSGIDPATIATQRSALAGELRSVLGPVPELDRWPEVSIVVPSRDGRALLEQLVAGLREHTDYPAAELVMVDNGSSDGSAGWLAGCDAGFPVHIVRNDHNASFAEACNQGVAAAEGELVLLLNNDIQPFERGWLRELVASHVLGEHTLTGATLLHAEQASVAAQDGRLLQHRGVRLRSDHGIVRPYNDGDGDPLDERELATEREAPAVSAACLLVGRDTYEDLGGLSPAYRYGLEDVDLALRATDAGLRVATTGRCVLYHAESMTREAQGTDFMRATREANRRTLLERRGAAMRRSYRQARLARDRKWTDGRGPHVVVIVTSVDESDGWGDWHTGQGLGETLTRSGWRVTYAGWDAWSPLPPDTDYVLTLLDRFDARAIPLDVPVIAWIRNWTERWLERPWFERLDVLLASSGGSVDLIESRTGRRPVLFPLATDASHFARATPERRHATDSVFVGNRWGEERAIEAGMAPANGGSLRIYGRNWKEIRGLAKYAHGPVAASELPAVYASSRLALDDTQSPTLSYGAVNARVFDALAAGTPVLTNCVSGVRELFDAEFPVWETPDELRAQRDRLLADDAERKRLAERYRAVVLARHTYEHRAHQLVRVLREHERLPSFAIKIGAPDWDQAERWGDLHFARGIERLLRRRGHRCLIQVLEEWEMPEGLSYDVSLHLKGLSRHYPKPGQRNVLWCISHPDELTGEECDGYDLVCVASTTFAEALRDRTSTPVMVLEQATDPTVFFPEPDPDESAHRDLVYVANSRNVLRPVMRDLLPTQLDLAVFGANWDGLIDSRYVVAEHVPNEELRRVYSSAKVVLADHWDDMREHGFISNRIYDALACGACVVSDDVAGLADAFPGSVATYSAPGELRPLLERLLADPAERAERGRLGRAAVERGGGFAARVDTLLQGIGPRSPGQS